MLRSTWRVGVTLAACAALAGAGCGGDDDARVDAGTAPVDASARDGGGGGGDAGPALDAAGTPADAAAMDSGSGGDAGGGGGDDASVPPDSGTTPTPDSGPRADASMIAPPCGGIFGVLCPATHFCDYPDTSMCGAGDVMGVCTTRPEICSRIYDPVCGCDGMDYSNPCTAQAAGTDVAYAGMCSTTADCRTAGCASGETCNLCRGAGGGVWVCLGPGTVC